MRKLAWIALLPAGALLFYAGWGLPRLGDPNSPAALHVSPEYIEEGPHATGAANMVTGILADYRSFDTLGETVVVLAAGLACLLLLGRRREDDDRGSP